MLLVFVLPGAAQEGTYLQARQAAQQGRTEEAVNLFCSLGNYKDAAMQCVQLRSQLEGLSRRNEMNFQAGIRAFNEHKYDQARWYFDQVTGPRYQQAQEYLNVRIPAAERGGGGSTGPVVITGPTDRKRTEHKDHKQQQTTNTGGTGTTTTTTTTTGNTTTGTTTAVNSETESLLHTAIHEFYAGKLIDSEKHLEQYLNANGSRRGICEFYLGASKLTRFYLRGTRNEDSQLVAEAQNAFRVAAKTEGFRLPSQYVSPKILEVYRGVTQ
jgi:hypothetical protein